VQLNDVKQRLDRGEHVDFNKLPDVNIAANLLKVFLKSLPESLIPTSLADLFGSLSEVGDEADRVKYLSWLLQNYIPDPNFATLKYILGFLSNVGIYSQHNRMHAANLALIFGPNLMWSEDDPLGGALGSSKGLNMAIQLMITHFDKIFESIEMENESKATTLNAIDEGGSSDEESDSGVGNGESSQQLQENKNEPEVRKKEEKSEKPPEKDSKHGNDDKSREKSRKRDKKTKKKKNDNSESDEECVGSTEII